MTEDKEQKYVDVPLTDEEYEEAQINLAKTNRNIENNKLQLKHLEEDKKNKYSERMSVIEARKKLKQLENQMKTDLETNELNKKVYQRQVDKKVREVPKEETSEDSKEE